MVPNVLHSKPVHLSHAELHLHALCVRYDDLHERLVVLVVVLDKLSLANWKSLRDRFDIVAELGV